MYDSDEFARPEVREVINETLRDVLSTDGLGRSMWTAMLRGLRAEFGIETDLLELAQNAPCLVKLFQIGAMTRNGLISAKTKDSVSQIIYALLRIAYNADQGDEISINQLAVIHKVAYPRNYELPSTVIKEWADSYHTSPHLARAWTVRQLMFDLSLVIEPVRPDRSVLDGPVKLTTRDLHTLDPRLYKQAEKHWKRGSTLQSLAIAIYIQTMSDEGITLETSQIKADLRKLKEWESNQKHLGKIPLWHRAGEYPSASLPDIPIYSEGWKQRGKRGIKKRKDYPR